MSIIKLTKEPIVIRKLVDEDIPQLIIFCQKCQELGYKNNGSLEALKFQFVKDRMGNFIIAQHELTNEIFSISGYHYFDDYCPNSWRVFYRSAQLPKYYKGGGLNYFSNSLHISHMLYLQIESIHHLDRTALIFGCSNIGKEQSTNMKTDRMNNAISKKLAEAAGFENETHNIVLYNTLQNIWRVDVNKYLNNRNLILDHTSYEIIY